MSWVGFVPLLGAVNQPCVAKDRELCEEKIRQNRRAGISRRKCGTQANSVLSEGISPERE
jgi:hypothetical protein